MEEETPHGVFEDAGLGWFSLCHVLCTGCFDLVSARKIVQNYQHEVSFFARASFKTLNAWNKPFAALIIRNQGKRLYKAQGRISGLISFTFFSAKKEKKLLVIQTACWWSLSFSTVNAEQVQVPGLWNKQVLSQQSHEVRRQCSTWPSQVDVIVDSRFNVCTEGISWTVNTQLHT